MEENNCELVERTTENSKIPMKQPKRVLFFSDGTLEEFSDSEEDQTAPCDQQADQVDTAHMGWGPWLVHKAVQTGSTTLGVCDYVGESLASLLGITTPKYHFELEESKRLEKERLEEAENSKGWLNPQSEGNVIPEVATEQPGYPAPTPV